MSNVRAGRRSAGTAPLAGNNAENGSVDAGEANDGEQQGSQLHLRESPVFTAFFIGLVLLSTMCFGLFYYNAESPAVIAALWDYPNADVVAYNLSSHGHASPTHKGGDQDTLPVSLFSYSGGGLAIPLPLPLQARSYASSPIRLQALYNREALVAAGNADAEDATVSDSVSTWGLIAGAAAQAAFLLWTLAYATTVVVTPGEAVLLFTCFIFFVSRTERLMEAAAVARAAAAEAAASPPGYYGAATTSSFSETAVEMQSPGEAAAAAPADASDDEETQWRRRRPHTRSVKFLLWCLLCRFVWWGAAALLLRMNVTVTSSASAADGGKGRESTSSSVAVSAPLAAGVRPGPLWLVVVCYVYHEKAYMCGGRAAFAADGGGSGTSSSSSDDGALGRPLEESLSEGAALPVATARATESESEAAAVAAALESKGLRGFVSPVRLFGKIPIGAETFRLILVTLVVTLYLRDDLFLDALSSALIGVAACFWF